MKKTLLLVRHATAEEISYGVKDFDRQLVGKGMTESAVMGKWLSDNRIRPDRYVSSPAARAFKTAEIVGDQLKFEVDAIVMDQELYGNGPKGYLHAVNTTPDDTHCLILFGHNPDITYFAEYLSRANIGSMEKASVVLIEFENLSWAEISGKTGSFISYTTPRQVREEE
ncbi:hypothetical protein DYBT9275_01194 [Dyadobacter sp. CECT 9275]|uniref:Phosphohistidine phosphatase n=1 Tax=Dyadobacter helix TaxID=2822344 RepID=A0A916N4U5_9BACT|nr:histidine phosphatase family protein [Dyadobacter sp. CECT 9275]CAG4993577.1 hypothetical protein DYBT9275_01194 [Dyadobacter sp. CECT 9275]